MEKLFESVKEIVGAMLQQHIDLYNANPDMFTIAALILIFVITILAIRELIDIFTGSNKSALKKKVVSLTEEHKSLGEKYNSLRSDFNSLEDHANGIEDYVKEVSSVSWRQVFTPKIVSGIVNQDRKIVQLAEDNYQFKAHLMKLGVTPEEIVELENKFSPEDDDKYFINSAHIDSSSEEDLKVVDEKPIGGKVTENGIEVIYKS